MLLHARRMKLQKDIYKKLSFELFLTRDAGVIRGKKKIGEACQSSNVFSSI